MVTTTTTSKARPRRVTFAAIAIAAGLPIVFFTLTTLVLDAVPHLRDGTLPDAPYVRNYVLHPTPAVLHVAPGLVFVLGAMLQVSARFRRRHLTLHRRLGRVLVVAGSTSALFAIYIGVDHPFNGLAEGSATVLFGSWLLWCLGAGFAAIRRRDVAQHRRWMIRAFVIALGIASIRLWTGVFITIAAIQAGGPPEDTHPQQATFGLCFWLGLSTHAAIAEWWLRSGRSSTPPAPALPGR